LIVAVAGLSGGSAQTAQVTLAHLDKFSYIGIFSRPPLPEFDVKTMYGSVLADPETNRKTGCSGSGRELRRRV
jgi:hypothetical protein